MIEDSGYFRRSVIRQLLLIIFFISGACALASIEIWFRLLFRIMGNSVMTSSAILVSFLFGFAMGAVYFGVKADREKNELVLFMRANMGLGIYSLFLLLISFLLLPVYKIIYQSVGASPHWNNVVDFVFTFILLIVPSVLIGGIIPALGRYIIHPPLNTSREVGKLSSIYISGAALGALSTGFVFFHIFGIKQSLVLVAVVSVLCALFIRIILKNFNPRILITDDFSEQQLRLFPEKSKISSQFLKKIVLVAFGILSFLLVSYFVLWLRISAFILGVDIYASEIILLVVLLGLTAGALFYSRFFSHHETVVPAFALVSIIFGASGILSLLFMPILIPLKRVLLTMATGWEAWNFQIIIYFVDAVIIFFLPATLMGATFVMVNRILIDDVHKRAQKVGGILAHCAIGALLGILFATYILIPKVGVQKSIIFTALMCFINGLIILFLYSFQYNKIRKTSYVFLGVVFFVLFSFLLPKTMVSKIVAEKFTNQQLIFVKHGVSKTTSIHRNQKTNHLLLASNGTVVGEKPLNQLLVKQILGHLPLLLTTSPDTVLVVGFGSGETIRNIMTHHVQRVDCVEISRELIETSFIFDEEVANLAKSAKMRFVNISGKKYVHFTDNKYNVIINNCFHPAIKGENEFFCKEYFQACRKILTDDGILTIVLPLYGITVEDFKIIMKTFQSVFPVSTVWYNNNSLNRHVLLIGNNQQSIDIDFKQIYQKMNNDYLMVELAGQGFDNVYEILDCFVMGPKEMQKLTLGVRINYENKPVLEFSAPQAVNDPTTITQILQLFKSYREPVYPYLTNIEPAIEQRDIVRLITRRYYESSDKVLSALIARLLGNDKAAVRFYQQAYMINRLDNNAKRQLDEYYDPLLIPSPKTPAELTNNAKIYYQKTEYEQAIELLKRAVQLEPKYTPAYFALGLNYEMLGDFEKAKQMYRKTLRLKPNLQPAQKRLAAIKEKLAQE